MIIGLDSIVPELIKRFAKEGLLPNMAKLMGEGVFGEGFATHPTLTGTNWTSIVCGTWPGTQGTSCMWTHFEGEPLNRVRSSFLSTSSRCEPLWEAGEKVGKKSIIMKYPCTVPPNIKRSIQVEGTGAPWYGLNPFEIAPCMCFSTQTYPKAQKIEFEEAAGWKNVPESHLEPLESQIEIRCKSFDSAQVFNILVFDPESAGYSQVIISKTKDADKFITRLAVGLWSSWLQEEFDAKIPLYIKYREDREIVYEDTPVKRFTGTFRFKLMELSSDGKRFKLYQSQVFPTTGFTWPEMISKELLDNVGPFQEHIGPTADFNNWIDDETFLEELEYQAWWLGKATNHLMTHYEWDLYFLQWHGPNHAQHTFWGGIDPISPWYDEKNASRYWESFKRFYVAADEMIGDIIKHADEETLVAVTADHGHIPYIYGAAMIGNALTNAELLTCKKDVEENEVVDWSKTKAYPINSVHIYVNLKGRDPDGIVDPGTEYDDVCNKVVSALYGIRDSKGNCPIAFASKKEDAEMNGLYGDRVGDVVYGLNAGYISRLEPTEDHEEFNNSTFLERGAVALTDDWADRGGPIPANTSIHGANIPPSRLGLGSIRVPIILRGPGIKKNYNLKTHFRLIDIAPTVSRILGIPTPSHCDGSLILEALQ
jgi:predicted AlkP superfamily phosphohydrolase/phosphomutase